MDRERLTELLNDPARTSARDVGALRSMAARFPWFSGAHFLLAAGEGKAGQVLSGGPDGNPAAYLPSRAVLYDLVHPGERAPAAAREEAAAEPAPEAPAAPEVAAAREGPAAPVAAEAPPPAAETPLPPPERSPAASAPEQDPGMDLLDRQISEAIQASGYQLHQSLEHLPAAGRGPMPPSPAELPPPTAAPAADTAPEEPAPQAPPAISAGTRMRLTNWLDLPAAVPAAPAAPGQAAAQSTPPAPQTAAPARSTSAIVEQFIQRSAPAAARPKASFFTPQQAAKKSLEDSGLVSETLAQVLEKQGNFAKAKEIYDRLALKHPGKSVYFAALSKALEARSNK